VCVCVCVCVYVCVATKTTQTHVIQSTIRLHLQSLFSLASDGNTGSVHFAHTQHHSHNTKQLYLGASKFSKLPSGSCPFQRSLSSRRIALPRTSLEQEPKFVNPKQFRICVCVLLCCVFTTAVLLLVCGFFVCVHLCVCVCVCVFYRASYVSVLCCTLTCTLT